MGTKMNPLVCEYHAVLAHLAHHTSTRILVADVLGTRVQLAGLSDKLGGSWHGDAQADGAGVAWTHPRADNVLYSLRGVLRSMASPVVLDIGANLGS